MTSPFEPEKFVAIRIARDPPRGLCFIQRQVSAVFSAAVEKRDAFRRDLDNENA
jgi:hypothetical protein